MLSVKARKAADTIF